MPAFPPVASRRPSATTRPCATFTTAAASAIENRTRPGRRRALLTMSMAACGATLATGRAVAADKAHSLRIATVQNADHPLAIGAQRLADTVSQRSGGGLQARLYPGGTLGGDAQVISSLQGGTVDMTVVSTGLLATMNKDWGMFYLPMLFENGAHADRVMDGPVCRQMLDGLGAKGLVGLAWWEHGFRSVTNSRRPIRQWEDLKGLKMRVVQIPIIIDIYNALGCNAVPMPFPELYTALEQKAVDGQENALAAIETAKFAEVQKYLSLTRIVYDPLVVLFSRKTWERLTEAQRTMLSEAAREVTLFQRKLNREHDAAMETGKSELARGLTVNDLAAPERDRMREQLRGVMDKHSAQYTPAMLKAFLEEVRKPA